ncbi:MAG: nucleotide exchange factor GrpE [Cyanophyceae cyanobacterium]
MIDNPKQPENTSENFDSSPPAADPLEENQGAFPQDFSTDSETPAEVSTEAETDSADVGQRLEETIGTLQAEAAALKQELEEQTKKTDAFKAQYVRIAADFDNFRKRSERDKENLVQQTKRTTIGELLAVVDNFERARAQIKPANDGELAIHKSYQGVYKNFVDSLKRIGVSAMRPEGQPFDPNYHEALLQEPTEEYPDGTVIEQLVRGYMLGDQVLRHARVKVSVGGAPASAEPEADSSTVAE